MERPTAIVYIDGFNLYRQRVQRVPAAKWLDFFAFASRLVPDHHVVRVKYFTTLVNPEVSPLTNARSRQEIYLRALEATGVEVFRGRFQTSTRGMRAVPLSVSIETRDWVRHSVRKVEEKRTDVALAVNLVADAHERKADLFMMLSNDSDQVPTIEHLSGIGALVGIIFPSLDEKRANNELKQSQPFRKVTFTDEDMIACQLPDLMSDARGEFHRPSSWA